MSDAEPHADKSETSPSDHDVPSAIDALFERHFAGTEITTFTRFWNQAHDFKEAVKRLLASED